MKKYLIVTLVLLGGCVYYNTFYNAEKYFAEAQKMELQDNGKPTSGAIQKYTKAIKKCDIVLEYYENSNYSDDAIFLKAKSFFYIGNNNTQAISNFEDLIKYYPESEYFSEAKLFLAQAKFRLNDKDEAYDILQKFIIDDYFKDLHPLALKILANFNLEEGNYIESEYYLRKIIEEYPKSAEYESAFFLRGKTQTDAKNFPKAIEIFSSLLETEIKRSIKLDARYFISYNHLQLENYANAKAIAEKLLKDEYRENKISKIQMVLARAQARLEEVDQAKELFEVIINDNKRTDLAAEANFYLGEMYYLVLKDYEKAIESYIEVVMKFKKSKFVEPAIARSIVANQIVKYHNPDKNTNIKDLILQHFKLAEYYIDILEQPDSAIIIYDKILEKRVDIQFQADSLDNKIAGIDARMDSLNFIISETKVSEDSLNIVDEKKLLSDEKKEFLDFKNNLAEAMKLYHEEFIPYAKFVKIWIYDELKQDSSMAIAIYDELKQDFPENKYTYAARKLLDDEEVIVSTASDLQEIATYENALEYFSTNPQKTVEILEPISENKNGKFAEKAKFVMGYLYYFSLSDSLKAKTYLDTLLANSDDNEIRNAIGEFYGNSIFKKLDRLPALVEFEKQKEEAEKEEKENQERENEEENSDSDDSDSGKQ